VNRSERRAAGGMAHRPQSDLVRSHLPGAVLVGLRGAGYVRLTPSQARDHARELVELADAAQGALS
jgi:hypothetical protein